MKDLVDVSGVHPDHEVLDLFDRGNPWLCLGTSSGFTDPNHPLVGLDTTKIQSFRGFQTTTVLTSAIFISPLPHIHSHSR